MVEIHVGLMILNIRFMLRLLNTLLGILSI